ncbi:MAG: type I 3-dehydroquinate dehydratase [Nitrososphaerota archaeon]
MRSDILEKICVSLLPRSLEELEKLSGMALEVGARLLELRLDGLAVPELRRVPKTVSSGAPRKIVTLRPRREGGLYTGGEAERLELLRSMSEIMDYVDLEHDTIHENPALVEEFKGMGVEVISSKHFLDASPTVGEMRRLLSSDLALAGIVKIVNSPRKPSEAAAILSLYAEERVRGRLVAFSMGEGWSLTRIFSVVLGAPFTYASLPGLAVAPGQLSLHEVAEALEVFTDSWRSSQS